MPNAMQCYKPMKSYHYTWSLSQFSCTFQLPVLQHFAFSLQQLYFSYHHHSGTAGTVSSKQALKTHCFPSGPMADRQK